MTQNLLNHLGGNSESVQIGRQPTTEGMPAVPLEIGFLKCRPNDIQRYELYPTTAALEEALAGSAEGLPEQFAQLDELLAGRS